MLKAAAERATVGEAKVPLTEMTEGLLRKTDLPDTRETAGHRAVSKDKSVYILLDYDSVTIPLPHDCITTVK